MTSLRLKLRKNQSTLPSEKLIGGLTSVEILGDSITKVPDLDHLKECRYLYLHCPELTELPKLPLNLEILKIRGGRFSLLEETFVPLKSCRVLSLVSVGPVTMKIKLPPMLETLDLSGNELTNLPLSLDEMKMLSRLSLDSNKLATLPESLFELQSLNHLSLDHNPLTEETKNLLHSKFGLWF